MNNVFLYVHYVFAFTLSILLYERTHKNKNHTHCGTHKFLSSTHFMYKLNVKLSSQCTKQKKKKKRKKMHGVKHKDKQQS